MKLIISEKQLELILSKELDISEQDAPATGGDGTSSTQSGGQGYPAVGKWESGVTRGPGNQIGITKWSDVVGSTIKRGKGNPLKEQNLTLMRGGYNVYKPQVPDLPQHTALEISALLAGLSGGFILPFILGFADSALYYKEGDKKTAGLVAIFSLLPGMISVVNKIPGIKQLGAKGMGDLAVRVSKGQKIVKPTEIEVVNAIGKNRQLIQQEIKKSAKEMASRTTKDKVKNVGKKTLNLAKDAGIYGGTYLGYNSTYDYYQRKEEEENLKKLDLKIKQAESEQAKLDKNNNNNKKK